MLKRLHITNYALIREAEILFPGGLSVITGETGAGKSILLDALGLALGKRADQSVIIPGKKCVVEAEFDISSLDLKEFFSENDLEHESNVVLRRELSADGRSRSLVNDAVVTLSVLKSLAAELIDIHSQHESVQLNGAGFQVAMLDALAGSTAQFLKYKATYQKLGNASAHLKDLQLKESAARKECDYYQFLFHELDELHPAAGELQKLEEESAMLENASQIRSLLSTAAGGFSSDDGLLQRLSTMRQSLHGIARFGKRYDDLYQRLNSCYIELKDFSREVENAADEVSLNDRRLDELNTRIDKLNRLLKKHGVADDAALVKVMEETAEKLHGFGSLESQIRETEELVEKLRRECLDEAESLSAIRALHVPRIEKQVSAILADLEMENAVFKVALNKGTQPGVWGLDDVSFMFNANKGGLPASIEKAASGGELSRLMLALKSLLAEKKKLPAVVFDEIDTGVSGRVADRIGSILLKMSGKMQVIAITHLPQLASKGDHHLYVSKSDEGDRTVSYVRSLGKKERVNEIAKMLSRGTPTETSLSNARELLRQ